MRRNCEPKLKCIFIDQSFNDYLWIVGGYEHEDGTSAKNKTNNNLQSNDDQVAKENMAMYEDDSNEKKVDAYKDENSGDTIEQITREAISSEFFKESSLTPVSRDSYSRDEVAAIFSIVSSLFSSL